MGTERDLFGHAPAKLSDPHGLVTVALVFVQDTDAAWLLKRAELKAAPKWAPKKLVKRGEGKDAGQFTMPRIVAHERGWL